MSARRRSIGNRRLVLALCAATMALAVVTDGALAQNGPKETNKPKQQSSKKAASKPKTPRKSARKGSSSPKPKPKPKSGPKTGPNTDADKAKSSGDAPDGQTREKDAKSDGGANYPIEIPPDVQRQIDELLDDGADPKDDKDGVGMPSSGPKPPGARSTDRPFPSSAQPPSGGLRSRKLPHEIENGETATPSRPSRNPKSTRPSTGKPSSRRGAATGGRSGATTTIEIPAAENQDLPPEERMYEFGIKNGTYAQLLEGVARQTGLGMQGAAPKDGRVNFVTEETLSFDEMLSRIRMLLFNYKPHEPYWLRREETHLEVIRVNDMYRDLEPVQIFRTLEDFHAANLPGEEIAMVIYTPKTGSISLLNNVRDFMPDYVRVAPLPDRNSVTIFALVRDINKYFELVDIFLPDGTGGDDPRSLEVIEILHLLPSDAWAKVETLMNLETVVKGRSGSSRRKSSSGSLEGIPEPEVSVVPDDPRGVLIVRAMQDKIDEIKKLLPVVDVPAGQEYPPVIITLEFLDAEDIVPMIEQLLTASSGSASGSAFPRSKSKSKSKKKRRGGSTAAAVTANDVVLIPHPQGDSIIVIASEEDVAEVRRYVEMFDREWRGVGPKLIEVNYADPSELVAVVTQVVVGPGEGTRSTQRFAVVPDPSGRGLWFTGPRKDYDKIIEIVAAIDVTEDPASLHIIRLEHQLPSFVVSILEQYDTSGSATPAKSSGKKRKSKRKRSGKVSARTSTGKFTSDDENMRLFALCTEDEWQEYLEVIRQLEEQVDPEAERIVLIPVRHIAPTDAVEKLKTLLSGTTGGKRGPAGGASGDFRFEVTETDIVVTGATRDEIEQMRDLLEVFDTPNDVEIEERIFELRHVDMDTMIAAIQSLLAAEKHDGGGRSRMARSGRKTGADATEGDVLTLVPIGNRLVVRTSTENMERVAALIAEFDVPTEENTLRVYDGFPPTADIQAIADTLMQMLVGDGKSKIPKKATPDAPIPKVIAQPDVGRLIVMAPPSRFEEIEELLDVLRVSGDVPTIETDFVEVHFADPAEIVELVEPLLVMKVNELVAMGRLRGAPQPVSVSPGKANQRSRKATDAADWFHLTTDMRHRRVVIAGPQIVIDEARKLVQQFDYAGPDVDIVVRTVKLENATAQDMVKTVREMMGTPARGATLRKKAGDKSSTVSATDEFGIYEAPGGRAVVLRGSLELVDQANEWITEFELLEGNDRVIEIFTLQYAPPRQIVDLLMATLDVAQPSTKRGGKKPARPRRGGFDEELDEDEPWQTEIKREGVGIYIQADLIAKTLIISATPTKLARAAEIIADMDTEKRADELAPAVVPSFTYELVHATDSFVAAFTLEMVLDSMWPYDQKPRVESVMWADNLLSVEYPDESKFPEIEELIVKYVDKRPEDADEIKIKVILAPEDRTADDVARWFKNNNPDLDVILVNLSSRSEEDFDIERLRPAHAGKVNPCVMPLSLGWMAQRLLSTTVAAAQATDPAPLEQQPGKKKEKRRSTSGAQVDTDQNDAEQAQDEQGNDLLESFTRQLLKEEQAKPQPDQKSKGTKPDGLLDVAPPESQQREQLRIYYNPETGEVHLEGRNTTVTDVVDNYERYIEEQRVGTGPPDIRIYRVKHIDVFTATNIIEEMFNATRQQRIQVQQQQRMQQQRNRQQQLQQQRMQQQQQQGKPQPGPQGRQGQQGQQNQPNTVQLPPTSVRVYPNPRDRTLILRADASQFPALLELLATIDQPQPIERKFRTFTLEKTNAVEVEEKLKAMLGLQERRSSGSRRSGANRGNAGRRAPVATTSPGSPLPENIMAKKTDGSGMLGVDPVDISISSNEEANTILVMAPKEALDYIGELIEQFENYEVPERIWKSYQLRHAEANEVVDYLISYFEEGKSTRASSSRGRGKQGKSPAGGRTSLNSPTFVAYPRLNLVSVQATQEQVAKIDEIMEQLDVRGDQEDWQTVTLARADAKYVADTLSQMFGGSSTPRRNKQSPSAPGPKFIGEEGSRVVFYAAPQSLHEDIMKVIESIESETELASKPRVIVLQHAKPTVIAEALEKVYGVPRGGRRSGRSSGAAATSFAVTAHDPSKQLFIVTDDETFAEVKLLVDTMDEPTKLDFEFRTIALQYADAKKVHGQMKKLMTDYIRQIGGRGTSEPFSIEVDEKANALVVLGGPAVFAFLEKNLAKIDIPENARSPQGMMIISLTNANAQEIAQNIARLWSAKNLPDGDTPPQAEANRSTNTLIVRGTRDQLDEIKRDFVDKVEAQQSLKLFSETITLAYADPEQVAESINRIFSDKREAIKLLGNASNVSPIEFTVIATPDVATKQVIVQAGETNMALIKARVAELDTPENAGSGVSMQVYAIKYADPNTVATIIREWARSKTQRGSGRVSAGDTVTATPVQATQSVVVTASAANHLIIKEMVDGLDDETVATNKRSQHVLPLTHANAVEVANKFTQVFRQMPRRRGDAGPGFVGDARSSVIIATVTAEELAEVQELLAKIDMEEPEDAERTTEVYPLRYADPQSLSGVITNVFRAARPGNQSPSEQVTAAVEAATQSLVVTANKKNHEIVRKLIEKTDVESMLTKEVYTVQLEHADAVEVARNLQTVYSRRRPRRRGDQAAQITGDANSNSLVVFASAPEMEELTKLIEALDVEDGQPKKVYVINLKNADADQVSRTLGQIFVQSQPRARGTQGPPISISALQGSKAILIKCSEKDYAEIAETVSELDSEENIGSEVRVVTLLYGDAAEMQQALQQVRGKTGGRGGRGGELIGDVRVAALPGSNSLVISGTKEEVDKLEAKVIELDKAGREGALPQMITLQYAKVAQILPTVQDMFERSGGGRRGQEAAVISSNDALNAILVKARPMDFASIEALVKQLDVEDAVKPNYRIVQVSPGVNLGVLAETVETTINRTTEDQAGAGGSRRGGRRVSSITLIPDSRTSSLTISGSPALFDDAEQLIREYEKLSPPGGRHTAVIKVEHRSMDDIQRLIDQLTQSDGGGQRSNRARRGGRRNTSGRGNASSRRSAPSSRNRRQPSRGQRR